MGAKDLPATGSAGVPHPPGSELAPIDQEPPCPTCRLQKERPRRVNRQGPPQAGATLNQDVVPAGPEPSPRVPSEPRGLGAGAAERGSETPLIRASVLNHDLSPLPVWWEQEGRSV